MNDKKTVIWKNGIEGLLEAAKNEDSVGDAETTVWKSSRKPSVPPRAGTTLPGTPAPEIPLAPEPTSATTQPRMLLTESGEPALPASELTQARVFTSLPGSEGQATRVLSAEALLGSKSEPVHTKTVVTPDPRTTSPSVPTGTAPSVATAEARRRLKLRIAIGAMAVVIAFLALIPKPDKRVRTAVPPTTNSQSAAAADRSAGGERYAEDHAAHDVPQAVAQDPGDQLDDSAPADGRAQAVAAHASLEQAAVNALASGDRAAALRFYDRLAQVHPQPAPFALAASILQARLEQPAAPR